MKTHQRRRRLRYRASHRGLLEMDLVLGGFVMQAGDNILDAELDVLEEIVDIDDAYVRLWLDDSNTAPCHLRPMIDRLRSYSLQNDHVGNLDD